MMMDVTHLLTMPHAAGKKHAMNVNTTTNLIISSVIEIIFTVIWYSCIISMVMRICEYYLLQKTASHYVLKSAV